MTDKMSRDISDAIDRSIMEARNFEENKGSTLDIDRYRASQENALWYYETTHLGPLKTIAAMIVGPIGIILTPVIIAGGLGYIGVKAIYDKYRNNMN